MSFDAAIVGAGPAGASAALFLARAGWRVALIDQARFPRLKACGEGVMPGGIPVLEALGVLARVEESARRFRGLRYTAHGLQAVGLFPEGRYGLAIRRELLDAIVLEGARSHPGVTVLEGHRLLAVVMGAGGARLRLLGPRGERTLDAGRLIGADGAASATARALGVRRVMPARRRFGFRAHFSGSAGLEDLVEVFLRPQGEAYVAPLRETGTALVALLVEGRALAGFSAGGAQAAYAGALALLPPLQGALQTSRVMGFGPLGGRAQRWEGEGWLLAGDAASSVDPIIGEGIALALQNGLLAAKALVEGAPPGAYTRARRALVRRKALLAEAVLFLCGRAALASPVLRLLKRRPGLFTKVLSLR